MPLLRDVKDQLGSSYLLEHADNPVRWRTWGEDALAEARRLDRPIFLSVGYAACHWCHVMAHESFEDEELASLLNEGFIPVKVDREERPDVDALYMAATQLISGHGGWPMSVFTLPDGRPFMAGTYYPPVDRGGQVGFGRLLRALRDGWTNQRAAVEAQADELTNALAREVRFVDQLAPETARLDLAEIRRRLRDELVDKVDADGGFGGAPKFPRPSFVEALLDFDDLDSRRAVSLTLEAMARRGLYDHFGGGFARYSVDGSWHVPHFEKMLSDQALLARCYLRAALVRDRSEWRAVALDTLAFVERDLRVSEGYAASLDADAGGVEGSHVTWTPAEVATALRSSGRDADLNPVLARWRLDDTSFEGRSIPQLGDGEPFETPPRLAAAFDALIAQRARRVPPLRDEKVILEWNAMLATAFLRSDDPPFVARGFELTDGLFVTHFAEATWWRTQHRRAVATAADVAWLMEATLDAFELSGEERWLERADALARYLLEHYWDGPPPDARHPHQGAGIFTQSDTVHDLALRPKEIFDGATPSAHAVSTRSLARLALCRGDDDLLAVAQRLVDLAGSLLLKHPSAVVDLLDGAGFALEGVEVVVPGAPGALAARVRSRAMPRTVLVTGAGASPLLVGRREGLAYVCRGGVCDLPAHDVAQLDAQLDGVAASWR